MTIENNSSASPAEPGSVDLRGLADFAADAETLTRLFSATYEELRKLASRVRGHDAGATFSPTDLVHEAWLKLAASPGFLATSPLHFKRIAARAMRQVLIEAARRRSADKRGGGEAPLVLSTEAHEAPATSEQVLALNDALVELARVDERQALLVEGRFFGGLDLAETAQLLGVSEATVQRDWRAAKAWLATELR